MKKVKILLILVFLLLFSTFSSKIYATNNLTSGDLIRIYNTSTSFDFTVKSNTKVQEIIDVFGEPKLITDSAFGGHAYTFYTDDNYSNYLYIETVAEDDYIISYGTIWNQYEVYNSGYDYKYNYQDNSPLQGKIFNENGFVKGGVYYNRNRYIGGTVSNTIKAFEDNYNSNATRYLKGISEQAVLMFRALLHLNGYTCNFDFDEEYFYINEQLKESGLPMREYLTKVNKSSYKETIGTRVKFNLNSKNYYLFSPATFVDFYFTEVSVKKNYTSSKIKAVFDYDQNNLVATAIIVDPNAFIDYGSAEMTIEEQNKYRAGKAEYERALDYFSKDSSMYSVNPVISPASGLVAGDLLENKKAGILGYFNAIRIAAGLPTVSQDTDAATTAQYMATLSSYRWNSLGLEIEHMPDKPSGVSDSFYNTAIGYGKSFAENISRSTMQPSNDTMMRFVNMFLDDTTETPMNLSHRALLLNPYFTKFGFGLSPNIGTIELSGGREHNVILKAWPAEGVTFMESLDLNPFYWSAQFIDKYTLKSGETVVTVKCINTGDTWVFAKEETTANRKYTLITRAQQELKNMAIFYDKSIIPQAGYVYEITLDNITDNDTGANTSYTYRSVFQFANDDRIPVLATDIEIDTSKVKPVSGVENTYYVPVNEEAKLGVNFASGVDNKKVTWLSDSQDVTVTQNGIVFAKDKPNIQDVKITLVYDATGAEDYVYVRPYIKVDRVQLSQSSIEMYENDNNAKTISIVTIPDEADEVLEINWVVIPLNTSATEYPIDSAKIKESLDITKINDRTLSIKSKTISPGNNKFKIIAKVKGLSADFTGSCEINIKVPLKVLQFATNNDDDYDLRVINGDPDKNIPSRISIDFNDFEEKNNTSIIKFKALFKPNNTTVEKTVTWSILNNPDNVLSDYTGNGDYRVNKPGTATIKIVSKDQPEIHAELEITITCSLKDFSIDTLNNQRVFLEQQSDKTYKATKQIEITKKPVIDNTQLIYTVNNPNIAKVDANGLVTFTGAGNVTVTVSTANKTIQKTINFTSVIGVTDINLNENAEILYLGKTLSREAKAVPTVANADRYIYYSSSNTNVATVSSRGEVKAVGYGEAVITATISSYYTANSQKIVKSYPVYVINPITSVTLSGENKIKLEEGIKKYTISWLPKDTQDKVDVRWSSSRPNVATIDQNGNLTPVGVGSTTVKAEVTCTSSPISSNIVVKEMTVMVSSNTMPAYLKGDINEDGIINADDAADAIEIFKTNAQTEINKLKGDMNEDGKVDAEDAALIIEYFKTHK